MTNDNKFAIKPVFVYGTLKSIFSITYARLNDLGWNSLVREEAIINGNLHIIPAPGASFPAVGKLNTGNIIEGELVYINDPIFLYALDAIESEGEMYHRVDAVTLDRKECWVYQWHKPKELENYLIEHGTFQYVGIPHEGTDYLGIPMQDNSGNTVDIFVPELFTIFQVALK